MSTPTQFSMSASTQFSIARHSRAGHVKACAAFVASHKSRTVCAPHSVTAAQPPQSLELTKSCLVQLLSLQQPMFTSALQPRSAPTCKPKAWVGTHPSGPLCLAPLARTQCKARGHQDNGCSRTSCTYYDTSGVRMVAGRKCATCMPLSFACALALFGENLPHCFHCLILQEPCISALLRRNYVSKSWQLISSRSPSLGSYQTSCAPRLSACFLWICRWS